MERNGVHQRTKAQDNVTPTLAPGRPVIEFTEDLPKFGLVGKGFANASCSQAIKNAELLLAQSLIATDRLITIMKARAQGQLGDPNRWEELMKPLPMGRAGTPREIGWMVAFLASDKSAYTTGTIVTIDGGAANRGPMF